MRLMWKAPLPVKYVATLWKVDNKGNRLMNLYLSPQSILTTYIAILVAPILQLKEANNSILVFEIVPYELAIPNLLGLKAKLLIHFRNSFVGQNASQGRNWSIYVLISGENLPIKLLRNILPRRVLSRSQVRIIPRSKMVKPNASITP